MYTDMCGLILYCPMSLVVASARTALAEVEEASLSWLEQYGQLEMVVDGRSSFSQPSCDGCPPRWSGCSLRDSSLRDCGVGEQ